MRLRHKNGAPIPDLYDAAALVLVAMGCVVAGVMAIAMMLR